jgi:hypothetical protein
VSQVDAEPPIRAVPAEAAVRRPNMRWLPVAAHISIALVLFTVVAVVATDVGTWYGGPELIGGWARYDAGWYRSIADNGYFFEPGRQSSVAFFPVYPLATRYLSEVLGGDPTAWGVALTFASGLLAAVLFHRWCRERLGGSAATTCLLVLLLWPYGWYLFGAVYADALFLAMALLAFTFVEKDRPVLAALAGAVATATRPVGLALVLGLVLRTLERRGALRVPAVDRFRRMAPARVGGGGARPDVPPRPGPGRWVELDLRRLRPLDPVVLLAGSGLAAYVVYLWRTFDAPFAFADAESAPGWDQHPTPRTWFKFAWFSRLLHLPDSGLGYFGAITFQAVLAVGLLAMVPLVLKRFGWGYAVYTLAVLAIPLLGSKDFMGLGRYALTAFPSFAVLGGELAGRPRARAAWLVASATTMVVLCAMFARNRYVA